MTSVTSIVTRAVLEKVPSLTERVRLCHLVVSKSRDLPVCQAYFTVIGPYFKQAIIVTEDEIAEGVQISIGIPSCHQPNSVSVAYVFSHSPSVALVAKTGTLSLTLVTQIVTGAVSVNSPSLTERVMRC